MKLRELLQQMKEVQENIGTSKAYICGGTPRDRYMGHLENISDVDITTGDKTVDYLSQELAIALSKKYNITRKSMEDGHSTIFIGTFKMDFSSNFNVPGIEDILTKKGIQKPTEMQKEIYSRDFTCNALLLSLDLKHIIDPTNHGFQDIKDKKIRTCLSPEITLTTNRNRVARAIYLACKLEFDIDDSIIEYVTKNPQSIKISTNKALSDKLNEAFQRDGDKASFYLTKMNLWDYVPILEIMQPYYKNQAVMTSKKAYFQGGGGVNEPTPKKKKYKSEKAIVVQPRFKEPFYHNYDLYDVPGVDGKTNKLGPGAGLYQNMEKYKSVDDFLDKKRKHMKDKYKADDSWIEDTEENRNERIEKMKTRTSLLSKIVKIAGDYMLPPKEHGTKIYDWKNSPYQGIPKSPKRHDSNNIDFPIDDDIDPELSGGMESSMMGESNLIGGYLDKYLPQDDFEGKSPTTLDFGRDYTEDAEINEDFSDDLLNIHLSPTTRGLYGLPDGVDLPEEDLGNPNNINPYYGTQDNGIVIYEDKWNI